MDGPFHPRRWLQNWACAGLDFIYPPVCELCGRSLIRGEISIEPIHAPHRPSFCQPCRKELTDQPQTMCRRCGAPVGPFLDHQQRCFHCRGDRFAFESVICVGIYREKLRKACLMAKKRKKGGLASALGHLLCDQRLPELRTVSIDSIIPVPHHWTQHLGGGYNSAALLARAVASRLKVQFSGHILAKARRTPAQRSLPSAQRRKNLRGAFRTRAASTLAGKTVLLVDDVLTTGTTAHEAAKTLRSAGAKRVVVAVLARGLGQTKPLSEKLG